MEHVPGLGVGASAHVYGLHTQTSPTTAVTLCQSPSFPLSPLPRQNKDQKLQEWQAALDTLTHPHPASWRVPVGRSQYLGRHPFALGYSSGYEKGKLVSSSFSFCTRLCKLCSWPWSHPCLAIYQPEQITSPFSLNFPV